MNAGAPPAVVEAVRATKRYGQVLGLNGFSATFGPGITGLVGPNGAGKTTLFRVLSGQLRLDAGTITILGRDAWNTQEKNRSIGYCPDHPGLYEWMRPGEFVETLLLLDGYEPAEVARMARSALETVDLWGVRDRKIRTFSKGMRQRVKVAQAIAHDPQVLFIDEPLNGLDPVGRVELLALFRRLAATGHHLLVSSHVLHEVERLTSQIVMISGGQTLAQGDLHRIRELLDQFPLSVELETSTPRAVARELALRPDVSDLRFVGERTVVAQTSKPDDFYNALPGLALQEGIQITGVRSLDDNLESVFRLLRRA